MAQHHTIPDAVRPAPQDARRTTGRSARVEGWSDVHPGDVEALLVRADDLVKAAPSRRDPERGRAAALDVLERARALLPEIADEERRLDLAAQVARRFADIDREELAPLLAPSPDVRSAPTRVDEPGRVPPGQHLTAGWPVLHVGRVPDRATEDWRLTVTGLVHQRLVLDLDALARLPTATVTADLHCVTGWTRLDNDWTGVRVAELLEWARPRDGARHAVVTGAPAYSANLDLAVLRDPDVLLAWAHDGRPLPREHGGPLRLVVPQRYGWKSVKWVFELRLVERDVRGYWEERGYHDVGDPWREQRFRGD